MRFKPHIREKLETDTKKGVFQDLQQDPGPFCPIYKAPIWASLVAQPVKNLPAMPQTREDGLGRSPGEGNGNPLRYSCLENSMDKGA